VDVLEAGNVDTNAIRILMDTLKLYERGEITLKQAEAKMTGR
jgi:exonuclease VII small subunit